MATQNHHVVIFIVIKEPFSYLNFAVGRKRDHFVSSEVLNCQRFWESTVLWYISYIRLWREHLVFCLAYICC